MTGITGLVGSSVAVALTARRSGCRFVCLTRGGGGMSAAGRVAASVRAECAFEGCPDLADEVLSRIDVIDCDVSDMDAGALSRDPLLSGVDCVFHCAADVNLGKDPTGRVFRINHGGTRNMVELARSIGAKEFHFVATAYVAGRFGGLAMESAPGLEYGFNNPYEESKCRAELLVRGSGIPFTVYRPAIIVGRSTDGRIRKPLAFYRILEFLQKMKGNRASKTGEDPSGPMELAINCDTPPSSRVYFVPIDYVQSAIAALFGRPAHGETYHVTGDAPVSVRQILDSMCGVMRITGFTVGGTSRGTAEERLFARFMGDLFPYFSSEVTFDQTNIRRDWPECRGWSYSGADITRMVRAYLEDRFPGVEWVKKLLASFSP